MATSAKSKNTKSKNRTVQIKFFTITAGDVDTETELNRFLRSVKVIEVRREFVVVAETAYWAICVLYLPHAGTAESQPTKLYAGKNRIDYREVLSPDDFNRFSELRKIRKEIAEKASVPPYVVFTDAELAEILKLTECTPTTLKKIKGIGASKIEKFGITFCSMAAPVFGAVNESEENNTAEDEESGAPF